MLYDSYHFIPPKSFLGQHLKFLLLTHQLGADSETWFWDTQEWWCYPVEYAELGRTEFEPVGRIKNSDTAP